MNISLIKNSRMTKQLSPELKNFIISFCQEMKIKNVDIDDLDLNTSASVDLDLNIFELDLDVFMSDFVKKFGIDILHSGGETSLTTLTGKEWDFFIPFSDRSTTGKIGLSNYADNYINLNFLSGIYRKRWITNLLCVNFFP